MSGSTDPQPWSGQHVVRLNASGLHEDTLRVATSSRQKEARLTLALPTLCITYADMAFQNAVGGLQRNYPASRAYGPTYFDPPVEIVGAEKIERLTYIRGASRVVIGPRETLVEFRPWQELVIPRLRLDRHDPAEAKLAVSGAQLTVDQPFSLAVRQFADGRHVGGVNLQARHPAYQPPDVHPTYDLTVRVIDALRMRPLVRTPIEVWHFIPAPQGPDAPGAFRRAERLYTGPDGGARAPKRPSGELEAVTIALSGWRVAPRCYRPLPGQPVRLTLRAWPLKPSTRSFRWPRAAVLAEMAVRCGTGAQDILARNGLRDAAALRPGSKIELPCFAGELRPALRETPQLIAKRFGATNLRKLARANGLKDLAEHDSSRELVLPGWHLFHALAGDTLETFDEIFRLRPGSAVAVDRVYRPRPGLLYAGEVVAVPG